MKIINIVGARPNFMKMAALYRVYRKNKDIKPILVHTGQHYSSNMSDDFLVSLNLPKPKYHLDVGGSSALVQVGKVLSKLEVILDTEKPDAVVVVGDVNSTLAGALAAKHKKIFLIHVEAGLRSFDRQMPEEINRIVTDQLSDLLFVTEPSGKENLIKEGFPKIRFSLVGNVMIDNLISFLPKINKSRVLKNLNLKKKSFLVMTMHRPANVDSAIALRNLVRTISKISKDLKIVFPVHPRTRKSISKFNLQEKFDNLKNLIMVSPLNYFAFLKLVKESYGVLTDSGGIQEEAAYLKVPVLTLRTTTERPLTVDLGANQLIKKISPTTINQGLRCFKDKKIKSYKLNDGKVAERIVKLIVKTLNK